MLKLTTQYGFLSLIMAQIRYISDLEQHKDYSHKAWHIERGPNTSIIDRGDNTSNIDHGDNTSIIDRGANTSIL